MSTQALEELINEDAEEGKMPSILIARVGTHLTGEVDDLKTLRSICDKHSMWLHVEGFVCCHSTRSSKPKSLIFLPSFT